MTQNWFATAALLLWPLVALALFHALPVNRALIWTILGGQLLLPVEAAIKFEGIPAFDKISIPSLAALAGCIMIAGRTPRFLHRFGLTELLLLTYVIGPFITSELNGDSIFIGNRFLPPLDQYEALSAAVAQFLMLIPFFLGRQLLRKLEDNAEVFRILVVAGLLYSLPILFEIRMSPQLHNWIYGYSTGSFLQQMRDGGFRPTVFMGHGLAVAFFMMATAVAAATFWRTRTRILRLPPAGVTAYISAILILCKSLGALVYCFTAVSLIRWTTPRLQFQVALVLVTIALAYPVLRSAGLFPTTTLVDAANSISGERAQSLEFRFDQEKLLLEHASHRFLFGWGRFGRNRVYDEDTGKDISITDGHWIITLGAFGFVGFVAEFGLLILPVVRAASALKFADSMNDRVLLAALALFLAINVIDLLPNASLFPSTWLLAGTLLGRAETLCGGAHELRKISGEHEVRAGRALYG